jgi:glycogen debranching enzyme
MAGRSAARRGGGGKGRRQRQEAKRQALTRKSPSRVRSIADAVVVKDEGLFFLCGQDGQVPLRGGHGLGLYYHDCRFLGGYELRLAGKPPDALFATAMRGFLATLEMTAREFGGTGGRAHQEDVGLGWQRTLDASRPALHDRLTFRNYGLARVSFPVALSFRASFEDVFLIRGLHAGDRGKLHRPAWSGGVLRFAYDGSDGLTRTLEVHFSQAPRSAEGTTAHFEVTLPARGEWELGVSLFVGESVGRGDGRRKTPGKVDLGEVEKVLARSSREWLADWTKVDGDALFLDAVIDRSLRDLRVLRTALEGEEFLAAGVPWFVTLFGRDSVIAAWQTLAYQPRLAEQTLRLLARHQGEKVDDWKDEQPGKVLHELRVGELARKGAIPYTPYYGTVDATPLFLALFARHAAWTGDLKVFDELRGHVERALEWVDEYGDSDGDGFVDYESASGRGLVNQGWKDSGDAIVNADGSLARPPIALVEVQGYVYLAKTGLADLYERSGDADRARQLRREARRLRERFNESFWLKDKKFYALALEKGGRPAAVISSNPGQALWSGIVDEGRAGAVVRRLMEEDLFSGWGIRTLSTQERRYNPVGYHLGTVWPHDNALIAAGFRRYGFDAEALKVFTGITRAATHFHAYRLPEVFSGFDRGSTGAPVRYPVACHPQAWAAGAVPYLLEVVLGLVPEAFDRRLRVVRPMLPEGATVLELKGLRVGGARVDLRFRRGGGSGVEVKVLRTQGKLDVVVERS